MKKLFTIFINWLTDDSPLPNFYVHADGTPLTEQEIKEFESEAW